MPRLLLALASLGGSLSTMSASCSVRVFDFVAAFARFCWRYATSFSPPELAALVLRLTWGEYEWAAQWARRNGCATLVVGCAIVPVLAETDLRGSASKEMRLQPHITASTEFTPLHGSVRAISAEPP